MIAAAAVLVLANGCKKDAAAPRPEDAEAVRLEPLPPLLSRHRQPLPDVLGPSLSADVHAQSIALIEQSVPLPTYRQPDRDVAWAAFHVDADDWPSVASPIVAFPIESESWFPRGPDVVKLPPARVGRRRSELGTLWDDIVRDHKHYYSLRNGILLAAGGGAAGVLAHSHADDWIHHDFYPDLVRDARTNQYVNAVHSMKVLGEGKYAFPVYAVAAAGSWLADGEGALGVGGKWSERSLRSVLVGGPPLLAMQRVLGASRPDEARPHWDPFDDENAVSGHAFMGAVPFITAAQMSENPWLRGGFYAGSSLAGLSRINDGDHYSSQVLMGWWMAYLAARSVDRTETNLYVTPVMQTTPDGFNGAIVETEW